MDIILDANTYLAEPRMAGPHFQELFAYLRRTGSRLVLPEVVLQEVLARYHDRLVTHLQKVSTAWEKMRAMAVSDPGDYPSPDATGQVADLRKRLLQPAPGVEVVHYDDFSGVDAKELVRRGVNRIRPASAKGEELRDVILWMMALQYAKASVGGIGFITGDETFADERKENLHPPLADDAAKAGVCVSFYRSIGKFIADNSLQTETATEEWFYSVLDKKSVATIAQNALLGVSLDEGDILKATLDHLRLSTGKRYRVAEDSVYTELIFSGTARLTIQEPEFVVTRVATPDLKGNIRTGNVSMRVYQTVYAASNLAGGLPGDAKLVPGNWVFPESVKRMYRCTFELERSARIEGGKLKSVQTDRVELRSLEHVPDLVE